MEHVVKGCDDCPLRSIMDNEYWCEHPFKKGGTHIKDDLNGNPITPSDCPLFKEPLTIKLVEE